MNLCMVAVMGYQVYENVKSDTVIRFEGTASL